MLVAVSPCQWSAAREDSANALTAEGDGVLGRADGGEVRRPDGSVVAVRTARDRLDVLGLAVSPRNGPDKDDLKPRNAARVPDQDVGAHRFPAPGPPACRDRQAASSGFLAGPVSVWSVKAEHSW